MKSRDSLIRLKRFQVDEKRKRVAQIETMIAEFDRMAADLDRQIAAEQERTGIHDVGHFAYSTFARAARTRKENMEASKVDLAAQLDAAREELGEAFDDLKKIELLDERDQARERAEAAAREQAETDAVALAMRGRFAGA